MRAVDVVQAKRDGRELSADEIGFFVTGYAKGQIPDYQASALTMAIYFQGMNPSETLALTRAMMTTGRVLDLKGLNGPRADKHSTGGVGDKTSLVLAPLAAACGVYVPMISGRSLGHTGGTLDKLESIPGFRVNLDLTELAETVRRCGLAITGQTPEIAPADRKLYALRDVTATVDSMPLIAASIMSKKLAEGLDALVLDVKTGDGAFMANVDDARELAKAMVAIGRGVGTPVVALVTDMDQPLGRAVGNALEVSEAIHTLKGRGPRDVESLSIELAARMVHSGGLEERMDSARARVRRALASGQGLERFERMIEAQGGDPRVCHDARGLPSAPATLPVRAPRDGRIRSIRCREIGRAAMLLGAGRERIDSPVDPSVGIVIHKKIGDPVVQNEPLATLHARDAGAAEEAVAAVRAAFAIGADPVEPQPLIRDVLH